MKRLAIITGTTRGLGAALVQSFREAGWAVAEMSRPQFDLAALDLTAARTFFTGFKGFDRVLLVHNAATLITRQTYLLTAQQTQNQLTVNLVAPIQLTSEFLKVFPAGEVALISSGAATTPIPHWPLYCVAKAGMEAFLRSLELEGTKTHLINPGVIDTDMQKQIRMSEFPTAYVFDALHKDGKLRAPSTVASEIVTSLT